jgi:hypothetical protein
MGEISLERLSNPLPEIFENGKISQLSRSEVRRVRG